MALPFELRKEQFEGIDFLAGRKRAFLWDDPGFGKTVQAIKAAEKVEADNVLVIAPASICPQWRHKIRQLGERDLTRYTVISFERAASHTMLYKKPWDLVIIDEGHYCKNAQAKRTKAVLGGRSDGISCIIENAGYVWELTGTPSPNNYAELWVRLRAMTPEVITLKSTGKPIGYWDFARAFCILKQTPFGTQIIGNKNEKVLQDRLAPVMLRRLEADHKYAPTIDTLLIENEQAQKALAALPETPLLAQLIEKGGRTDLAALDDPQFAVLRRLIGIAIAPYLANAIHTKLESGIQKIVVMAHHRDVIKLLAERLQSYGHEVVTYQGGMTENESEHALSNFRKNNKVRVFIGQLHKAGTGVDGLQDVCSHIILAEFSGTPGPNEQAIKRIARTGQKHNVSVEIACLANSIHEELAQMAARRAQDIKKLIG